MNQYKDRLSKTLCCKHEDIIYLLKESLKLTADSNVKNKLKEAIYITRQAKKDGQKMENRLKLYKDSIERLGYKRDKNN